MIRVLDSAMVNKIAAGEVIERPVSVVKELVENSIDAKADKITVEIKEGGILQIKVTDNGLGIAKNQVKTAFLAHATSKISVIEDLETITSLGFRGEALASIASISQVEIQTKTAEESIGYKMELHGGIIEKETETAMNNGTSITIRNLFYNTPARRKFLKRASIEAGYIYDIINKLALSNTNIAFKYVNESKTLIQTMGNSDVKTVLLQLYGNELINALLDLDYELDGIKVNGFVGKPEITRGNRSYEHFFINGRFVKNDIVNRAVEKVYNTMLPTGKFPFFVINMEIDPALIDVNVHPTKLEIRFSNERKIFELITKAVQKALNYQVLIPSFNFDEMKSKERNEIFKNEITKNNLQSLFKQSALDELPSAENTTASYNNYRKAESPVEYNTHNAHDESCYYDSVIFVKESVAKMPQVSQLPQILQIPSTSQINNEFTNCKIIGQIFGTYWLVENKDMLYIIDQHAAHERMIFEDIYKSLKNEDVVSQKLLQPILLNLKEPERQVLSDNIELLEKIGCKFENFDDDYALTALPLFIKEPVSVGFVLEIIDKLSIVDSRLNSVYELKLDAIASISCKAAVKAQDKLSYLEAESLIKRLVKLDNPYTCPHGRPTIVELSRYEIEKRFKRV